MRTRASAGVLTGLIVVMLSAAAAWAYGGSAAGKRLAAQMLASYKHVHYLAGSQHGSVYYCTAFPEGVYLGQADQALSSCKTPATDSWVATLSHGRGVSAVGTVAAGGHPNIDWTTSNKGTFWRVAGTSCWQSATPDISYVGSPPFGYFPKEYLTIAGHSGANILLVGTASHFKETDTISSSTHEIVGEDINFGIGQPASSWILKTHYRNASTAPAMPAATPVCAT